MHKAFVNRLLYMKRSLNTSAGPVNRARSRKRYKPKSVDSVGAEGVLRREIDELLCREGLDPKIAKYDMEAFFSRDRSEPWPGHREVEVEVLALSSLGVGLALHEAKPVIVPCSVVGDKVRTRIFRTEEFYTESELVEVLRGGPDRDNDHIRCRYFGKCSGCQYQHVPYSVQLEYKRTVVCNAYKHLSPKLWASGKLPKIHATIGSPKEWGYRTKLTPHFDAPPVGPIGFGMRARKDIVDIEECMIGTDAVNRGLTDRRGFVHEHASEYKRGATILLREGKGGVCVFDNRAVNTEQVGDYIFTYRANEFFQNNNSILPVVTAFVRDNIKINGSAPKFLVDTYCGCGLFAIACSQAVDRVIGVEISQHSVDFAKTNVTINKIENAEFIVGQAERIFEHVSHDPSSTAVVIDPPRKGCDKAFLDQLLAFKPAKVVYVSCNVQSQARDLEYFMENAPEYVVESLGGFDFFPQTHHVEGVAVLALPG